MPHDKVRAAARKRMAETGEPYTAARRAVVSEHQAAGAGSRPPGAGYALRMSGEIHDWLTGLRRSDQPAALRVVKALATLMREGASLSDPLVVSTADSWPWALAQALERSYQERLDRLTALRRGEADAATLVKDIQDQIAELEATQATLEELHRRALATGRPREAAQAAGKLGAVQQQAAEVRRLLPRMIEARNRLRGQTQRLQARVEAFRARKETLKARHAAVRGSRQARQAMAALDLADDDGDQHPESSGEAARAEAAKLADITAQMERELGQQPRPEGLMELWPGAPWHEDFRILFAVEPPGAALLIAVLEGPEAVMEQYPEAVMASADMLRRVRAGQAPEAAAHAYDGPRSFVEEFYPGTVGDLGVDSSSQ
jgi:phage shock protein A